MRTIFCVNPNMSSVSNVWQTFWYEKNFLGDIVAVYSNSGTKLISYAYDAYGNVAITYHNGAGGTPAAYNPFTYRGYYYDSDLMLYYLNSRYYDSEIGRFISADNPSVTTETPMALTDKNLYAYCDNNPVNRVDPNGEFWLTTIGIMAVGALIGGAISTVSSLAMQELFTGEINWNSVGVSAATGAVSGAISASPIGRVGQTIIGGIVGEASYVLDAYVNDLPLTLDGAIISLGLGALSGWLGGNGADHNGALSNAISNTNGVIAREARRANQKYAQKVVSKAISSRNNTLELSTWSSSVKFGACSTGSNAINNGYNENRWFSNWPSWKPW